jgi:hypothetical protein
LVEKTALIVTTIASPNGVLKSLAQGSYQHHWDFIAVGDVSSPEDFVLEGCDYYDMNRQIATGLLTARQCPVRHYARKNIGYLIAIKKGATIIVETDDDNSPKESFWLKRQKIKDSRWVDEKGWVNVYRYFSDDQIWPRGLPLSCIKKDFHGTGGLKQSDCPIQQGLVDDNPDVDAIYRMVAPLPYKFKQAGDIALGAATWSPFNSQNTTWWRETFPLMYLPAYCSFRMTDIWRSFVAQRIAWENGWSVLFHSATVDQERNQHDLMKDFADEVPGYLQNENIQKILERMDIKSGVENIPEAMRLCYGRLIKEKVFDAREMDVLEAWLQDLNE